MSAPARVADCWFFQSDTQTVLYLRHVNSKLPVSKQFIISEIGTEALLLKNLADIEDTVRREIDRWIASNSFSSEVRVRIQRTEGSLDVSANRTDQLNSLLHLIGKSNRKEKIPFIRTGHMTLLRDHSFLLYGTSHFASISSFTTPCHDQYDPPVCYSSKTDRTRALGVATVRFWHRSFDPVC